MHKKIFLFIFLSILLVNANAQKTKFDTTVKSDKVGYRIVCNNKNPDYNTVSVIPIGFINYSRSMDFMIIGKVVKAEIDDFNSDGYPDVIFYSYDEKNRATVYSLASAENKSCVPIIMPDIYQDPKLRDGYQGHDEFSIIEGFLSRKFPIYKIIDSTSKIPQIVGKRIIQYKTVEDKTNPERPLFKFTVLKSIDIKQ